MSLVLAVLTVGLLAMAGLVVDGGAALAARGRAADVAQQAARAGADALVPGSVRSSGPAGLRIDAVAARAAAERVLAVGEVTGQVRVDGDTVTVRAQVRRPTAVLSAVGLDEVSGAASATAKVLYGGTGQEGGLG